ncbi:MAG: Signal peptidase I, partial [uncultured Thermomicrobiales bacterium]
APTDHDPRGIAGALPGAKPIARGGAGFAIPAALTLASSYPLPGDRRDGHHRDHRLCRAALVRVALSGRWLQHDALPARWRTPLRQPDFVHRFRHRRPLEPAAMDGTGGAHRPFSVQRAGAGRHHRANATRVLHRALHQAGHRFARRADQLRRGPRFRERRATDGRLYRGRDYNLRPAAILLRHHSTWAHLCARRQPLQQRRFPRLRAHSLRSRHRQGRLQQLAVRNAGANRGADVRAGRPRTPL